jgi:hypothetical protein
MNRQPGLEIDHADDAHPINMPAARCIGVLSRPLVPAP